MGTPIAPVRRRRTSQSLLDVMRQRAGLPPVTLETAEPTPLGQPGSDEQYFEGRSNIAVPGMGPRTSNQALGARRVGEGISSTGMMAGGSFGSPLMMGSMPEPVARPVIASRPMVGGNAVSSDEFQRAWKERQAMIAQGKPPADAATTMASITAPRVLSNTVPVAPSIVPGSNLPDDRPSVWSQRARQSMSPSATGTQVQYRNPDGSISIENMPIVGGAGAMTPSQLRAAVAAAANATPTPAPIVPKPIPGASVPVHSPAGWPSGMQPVPGAPGGAFPSAMNPPHITPGAPGGNPIHAPAGWPVGMQPTPQTATNPFPAGMGAAPAATAPGTAPTTTPAVPAGMSTRAKIGTALGTGAVAAGVYSAMPGGPDSPQVVSVTPSGNPVYEIPGAITIRDPNTGDVTYKVGPNKPHADPNVAMARLRSLEIGARHSGGKDPGWASRRAQVGMQDYAYQNPQEVMDATTRIAVAQAAGRDGRNSLGEGAAMSVANQGLVQRQIMTDEQAVMMDQSRTPEERAAARQRYDAAAASMPEIPTGPVEYTPAEIQNQLIGGPVQGPVYQRQAVPQPMPPGPVAPIGGTMGGGAAQTAPPPGPDPNASPADYATQLKQKEELETAARRVAARQAEIAAQRVPFDFDPDAAKVLESFSKRDAIAWLTAHYPEIPPAAVARQVEDKWRRQQGFRVH